jgi:TatD DNase family protein
MFVDTHTHLFVDAFDADRKEVVERAISGGIEKLLLPNIDVDTIQSMNDLCSEFPNNCFPMMGLHPGNVGENYLQDLKIIKEHLFNGGYIAVGEIGMDLYWDKTFIEQQKDAFAQQVKWAKELRLPIAIHAREAFQEIFEILDELNDDSLTGVFHCFTGGKEEADKVLSYGGFKMGIGGVVTYKNGGLDKTLIDVPLENLILETDSPYLTPVPFRGKRNESSYILHIAEKLASIYQVKLSEVEEVTTNNAIDLFKIPLNQ